MEPDQFTLEEANALIPWLAEKFKNLDMIKQEYTVIQRLIADSQATPIGQTNSHELKTTSDELSRLIEEGIEEILDQGIIVRDVPRGLVDFPSLRDGRDIYLCWIGGEDRIKYWHETDQGFSHRQPF